MLLLDSVVISAIELSSDIGLVAVGLLTTNILLGLLVSIGYNPTRRWPRRRFKLFTLHNWTGYIALATATLHPVVLLFSATAGFRLFDVLAPITSPSQPLVNTLGADRLLSRRLRRADLVLPARLRVPSLETAALHDRTPPRSPSSFTAC